MKNFVFLITLYLFLPLMQARGTLVSAKAPSCTLSHPLLLQDAGGRPATTSTAALRVQFTPSLLSIIAPGHTSAASYLPRLPIKAVTTGSVYESNRRDFVNGLFYGLLAALMIYNLFIFVSLRDATYLFYVAYILFSGLHQLVRDGYLADFPPIASWLDHGSITLPPAMIFGVFFTNAFLQTARNAQRIHRLRGGLILYLAALPFLYRSGNSAAGRFLLEAGMYGTWMYWIAAGIVSYRNGFKPALYYIAGFGMLIVFSMLFNLEEHGLVNDTPFIALTSQTGAALQAVILSFALAGKINFYKREKELLQHEALRQASAFSRELIKMQEHERKRIASELHDSVGQQLILVKNKALLLRNKTGDPGLQHMAGGISGNVADTIQEIRNISYSLRPYQMDMLGLSQSIQSLADETGDSANVVMETGIDNIDGLFSKEHEMNIYRIVQELLNNMVKHSGATLCTVRVHRAVWVMKVIVTDNGKGIQHNAGNPGFGLFGIRERAQLMGGHVTIHQPAGHGTAISVDIPISYYESN
ncbi:7TM diverse intracellular signaling domain-containing protein [Chitinophaga sp. GCM10012297]|uniref:Oxygen sensor histidine kinase NreB n=1 Tax=Chitinophaga chungangae TaxID=2821488 RepID=A0ABS3YCY0_9BACT|nr:sensor histidine kinase [Chitinophaga chungangae]MBO9152540.1 sensor histidine kinase [Chitinophaga chungangae]